MPAFKPAYLVLGDDHGRIAERRAKLRALAEAFLQETGFRFGAVRFDVASVSAEGGRSDVEVFEDAF